MDCTMFPAALCSTKDDVQVARQAGGRGGSCHMRGASRVIAQQVRQAS